MMLEKNEKESTQLLYLYSQFQNWLIHFQELYNMIGTKFLQKGTGSFRMVRWPKPRAYGHAMPWVLQGSILVA